MQLLKLQVYKSKIYYYIFFLKSMQNFCYVKWKKRKFYKKYY